MKSPRTSRSLAASIATLLPVLTLLAASPGAFADVTKANNTTALNLAASYTPSGLPLTTDKIIFDNTISTAANNAASLGGDLSVAGLVFSATTAFTGGGYTINGTTGATLTLGSSAGILLSSATQNLTLNNAIKLGASQTWDVVTSGRTLTLPNSASIDLGANVLTVQGAGNTTAPALIYGNGSILKAGAGTLTLSSGIGSGATGNSGNLFSGGINHTAGTLAISGNNSGTGAITSASTLNITAAQFLWTGGLTVTAGTTTLSSGNAGGFGAVVLNGGTLVVSNATALQNNSVTLTSGTFTPSASTTFGSLAGSVGFTAAAGTLTFGTDNSTATYGGNIAGAVASNVVKSGSGTQILNGTNATTGTITANGSGGTLEIGGQFTGNGVVAVNAGTLRLNFNAATAPGTNILLPATLNAASTAGGGTLAVVGKDNAASSQTFTSTTFNSSAASTFSATAGAGTGTVSLNLGSFSRSTGSAVNFILPTGTASATNGILTSSGNASSVLRNSALAAYGTVGGAAFAAKDGTNTYLTALTGSVSAGATSLGTSTQDSDIDGVNGNPTVNTGTINTIRFNDATTARTLTINSGQTLTVTSSGILVSNAVTSAGSKITGGSLTSGATSLEIILHQFSAQPFTLDTVVTGTGVSLTKAGPGTLVLTKANTLTGATYVDAGVLQIGAGGGLNGSVVNVSPNDPTAVLDINNQTVNVRAINGGSATGGYVTLGNSGVLNLTGSGGTLSGALVGGVNSVINLTNSTSNPGFQTSSNLAFYGTINAVASGSSIGVFSTSGNLTNATINLSSGANFGSGGGFITRLDAGNLNGAGGINGGTTANTSPFALSVGYLGANGSFSGVIANGSNATQNVVGFTKFGSGTQTLSGTNTYTGATTINSGGVIFDYATNVPLPTASALTIGGGTATFLGKASGATTISTGTFGVSNGVLSKVTVNANTGTGTTLTLQTAVVNSIVTLGSTTVNNNLLFDLSSSSSNVLLTSSPVGAATTSTSDTIAIRTNNGLLTSGAGNAALTGYRANVLIKDSTGIGFAQASGTTISRFTTPTALLVTDTATALSETSTGNYILSVNLTRGASNQFLYNTLQLDSSTQAVTLTTDSNGNRFGAGVASTSGRSVLATGTNGATITSGGGTNQATYFNNYQTGTTAGQTLTLNMNLAGSSYFNGTGLTVATGLVNSSDQYFQSGVTRLTGAQSSGDALTGGNGVYRLVGGVLEIGADLSGSTSATATADFSRTLGNASGQTSLLGDTGFSAFGANRTVNLGGFGQQLVWGNDHFLASTAGSTTEGNNTFKLSSAFADSTIDFQNGIAFGSVTRTVEVANGSAAIDARLSGVLSGVVAQTATLSNGAPAVVNAAAGLTKTGAGTLELTGLNTYTGPTTVTAGTLLVSGSISGSTVLVKTGAILSGGTTATPGVTGAVTVESGGTISPGNTLGTPSTGTLNTGALSLQAASTFRLEIDTTAVSTDLAASSGALTLSLANDVVLSLADLGGNVALAPGSLKFITYNGTWNGGLFTVAGNVIADDTSFVFGSNTFTLDYNLDGNSVALVVVPEPGVAASLLGGFTVLLGLTRRRRWA